MSGTSRSPRHDVLPPWRDEKRGPTPTRVVPRMRPSARPIEQDQNHPVRPALFVLEASLSDGPAQTPTGGCVFRRGQQRASGLLHNLDWRGAVWVLHPEPGALRAPGTNVSTPTHPHRVCLTWDTRRESYPSGSQGHAWMGEENLMPPTPRTRHVCKGGTCS